MRYIFNLNEQLQNNIIKINNLNTKNKTKKNSTFDFLTMIINEKNEINKNVADMKTSLNKVLFKLENEKDEVIDKIEDFCDKNENYFDKLKSVSYGIRQILSGDVDSVCRNMTWDGVDRDITNLQQAVKNNKTQELKEYYNEGIEDKESFEEYVKGKDESIKSQIDWGDVNTNEVYSALGELKDMYENLFDIQKEIDDVKANNEKQLNELEKFLNLNYQANIRYGTQFSLSSDKNKNKNKYKR